MTALSSLAPLLLVALAVTLNLVSAALLKELVGVDGRSWLLIFAALGLVALVNVLRFAIWGMAHQRYPLSRTYPLSCLFFPMILMLSYWYGEEVGARQVLGSLVVTGGVFWLVWIDRSS